MPCSIAIACLRAALSILVLAVWADARPATAQTKLSAAGLPDVPTTRVLAVGRPGPQSTLAAMQSVMPEEVSETTRLYLAGKIAEWYVRKDKPGVVFILDVRDVTEARGLLEAMPFGKSGLLDFDLVPLGPLAPLGLLLSKPQ